MLSSQFFTNNRKKLRSEIDSSVPIVVFSNGLVQRSRDSEYRFEQDRNFFYLTGVNLPEWILVIEEDREYLVQPERTEQEEIFNGAHNYERVKKVSGVSNIVDQKTGLSRIKKYKNVLSAIDYRNKQFGIYSNPFAVSLTLQHEIKPDNITNEVLKLRTIKSVEEIAEIKKAIRITKKGFAAAKETLKAAKNEADIQAVFDAVFTREYSDHAYNPIVASGANACTLHYVDNKDELAGKGLLLIDIGARSNYYAADVSRTWILPGASKRQMKLADEVRDIFNEIAMIIKPGLHLKDYQKHVDELMSDSLNKLGLKNDEAGMVKYFPHAPSHGLGLDVHDPIVGYDSFQKGMVITLEPGIYIPEEGIGVRYEDDLLITDKGVENLSKNIEE